jgi:hypothetical protein
VFIGNIPKSVVDPIDVVDLFQRTVGDTHFTKRLNASCFVLRVSSPRRVIEVHRGDLSYPN